MGASAQSSISYIIDGLGWANSGAILALLYFSPIKKEFDKFMNSLVTPLQAWLFTSI